MEFGTLVTAFIGAFTTFLSGFTSWFFTRRKYNAEVDSTAIDNIEASLKVYQDMVKDLGRKLDVYGKIVDKSRGDLIRVKNVVINMMGKICTVESCKNRCPYSSEETETLLKLLDFEVDESEFKEEYNKEKMQYKKENRRII